MNRCDLPSPNCDFFYLTNGTCVNCTTYYVLANGTCVPNLNCTSRQFFSQGRCVDVPLACANFTTDGLCTKCTDGNTLIGGLCTASISIVNTNYCNPPCRTCFYLKPDYCFSCQSNWELVNHAYGSCKLILFH